VVDGLPGDTGAPLLPVGHNGGEHDDIVTDSDVVAVAAVADGVEHPSDEICQPLG
jgi:hypothetical protein